MKKHIFAYVGSRRPESETLKETKKIINIVQSNYPEKFTYEIVTPLDLEISPSTGCSSCFYEGICPIEEAGEDDSAILKKNMLEADFIILASPVYEHNVSSDTKSVIDRLSYWGHLFRLAGKSGVVLARGDSNGVNLVSDYLEKISNVFGLNVIDKLSPTKIKPLDEKYLTNLADEIFNFAFSKEEIEVDERAEAAFQKYQRLYKHRSRSLAEPRYWDEHGMFEHESLQSYVDEIVKKQKRQFYLANKF